MNDRRLLYVNSLSTRSLKRIISRAKERSKVDVTLFGLNSSKTIHENSTSWIAVPFANYKIKRLLVIQQSLICECNCGTNSMFPTRRADIYIN